MPLVIIVFYIYKTVGYQRKVYASTFYNVKEKIQNSVLIWVVPFLWYLIIKDRIKPKYRTNTKTTRDRLRKENSNGGFHESGSGFGF